MTVDALRTAPLPERATKTERLALRVSPEQKQLFEDAAAATDRTVTDFVVQSAAVAARDLMSDRSRFVLGSAQWAAFSAAIDRAPQSLPRLAAFLAEPSVLDKA